MKQDMNLIRAILFTLEEHPSGFAPRKLYIEGHKDEEVAFHVYLMVQAGLLEGTETTHMSSSCPEAIATCITWQGYEFLDAARDPSRWEKAKGLVEKVGGASLEVWKNVLTQLAIKGLNSLIV